MVLPILGGILGAGLLTLAGTHGLAIPAYKRQQGRRMGGILDDLPDDATSDDQIRALSTGGLLSPQEFAQYGFGDANARRDHRYGNLNAERDQGYSMERINQQYGLMDRNAANQYGRQVQQGNVASVNDLLGSSAGTYGMGLGGSDLATAVDLASTTVANMESGGNYRVIGPETKNGNKAYGKYQVMDFNIPSWTAEHYGQTLTPDQFLRNEAAQEAVFAGQFGRSMQQHGFANAASIWHSGRDLQTAVSDGAADVNMRTLDYVRNVTGGLGNVAGMQQSAQARFTPELRAEVMNTKDFLDLGAKVTSLVQGTSGAGRKLGDTEVNQMRAELTMRGIPVMQAMLNSGVLNEGEREFIEGMIGDPLSWKNATNNDLNKFIGLTQVIEDRMNNKLKANNIVDPQTGQVLQISGTTGYNPDDYDVVTPGNTGMQPPTVGETPVQPPSPMGGDPMLPQGPVNRPLQDIYQQRQQFQQQRPSSYGNPGFDVLDFILGDG